jgi:PAS domain S-box-containing protein
MGISGPMLDSDTDEFLGVVVAKIDLRDLYKIVTEDTGFGKTEEMFILNKYGYMITPSKFLKNAFLKQKVDTENSRSCLLYRDKGGICNIAHYIMICPDYRGVIIAGSNAYIPEMQWSLLSKIDTAEALAPLKKITLLFLIILFASPLVAWLLGLLLSAIITGPIHKLRRGAEIIGEGNLDYKVGTNADDEIGQLSRAFDKMTEDLKHTTTSVTNLNEEILRREKIEEKLKDSEHKIRAVLDQTFQFIALLDMDGVLVEINKAALNFAGIEESQVMNKPFWETPWWTHSVEMQAKLRDAIKRTARGEFVRFEATHLSKDGSLHYIDFSLKPVKDGAGKIVFMLPEGRDITDRKNAEKAANRLAAIVESSDDAIIGKDLNNIIMSWNKGAEHIYGYSEKEVLGKHVSIIAPEEYADESYIILQKIREGQRVETFETVRKKKDGTRINVSLTVSPIIDSNGNVTGMSTLSRDITESIKIAKALEEADEKLKEVDKRKSAFVAHVSHEFKNPLAVVRESLGIILDGITGEITPKQKEILESGKKNIERLIRLVTDLLDISKIEAGKMELRREEIDIGSLVNYVLATYEKEISKKGLSLKKDIPKDIGFLWADKDKIEEVLINLLSNAIKYTPSGGNIAIKLMGTEKEIRFEISDTGHGIAKEDFDKLFDKFERITAERQEGTGLGLSISKSIIELHRGKIWVESEPGKGSKFIFILPRNLRR